MSTKDPVAERGHILIVDDTPENIDVLVGLLQGYRLSVALDGQRALDLARVANPPDLVLLDIMMPGMDGFEVCRRLKSRSETREIPIIFITALGASEHESRALGAGGVDFVTKPFSPEVVVARVRTHIHLKHARDALSARNRSLEEIVAERTRELREALRRVRLGSMETIVRLARAAEYRDEDTGAHILRMSHYAAAIARQIGQKDKDVDNILHAAPMHDIGKIGIPDGILHKPSALSDEEWTIMKTHTQIGARILSGGNSDVIKMAEAIALTHHEKWDGSGYPDGLSGEAIPLAGRIAAVADVFDALTSKRPYKDAFSVERAIEIIREGRGSHFDPQIVDGFLAIEREIRSIKAAFPELQSQRTPHAA